MSAAKPLYTPAQPAVADFQERAQVAAPRPDTDVVAGIAVLSDDATLRGVIDGISSAVARTHFVDEWAALIDALVTKRCDVVLLDADRAEPALLDARLAELNLLPTPPVIIVAAGPEWANESMELLAARLAHRVLLKPATHGAARLALDYAIARSRQERPVPVIPATVSDTRYRERSTLLAIGMVIVFAVTVAIGFGWRDRSVTPPAEESPRSLAVAPIARTPLPAASETVALPETPRDEADPIDPLAEAELVEEPVAEIPTAPDIERLLQRGEARLRAGDLVRPREDNAFVYYFRAAAIDGDDARVAALRAGLSEAIIAAALQALEVGDTREVELLLEMVAELGVDALLLGDLQAQLQAVYATQEADRQAAHEAELLRLALERSRARAFVMPEGDSAAFYLTRLRAENPDHPGLKDPWAALVTTLAESARAATMAGQFASAADSIEWLRKLDADPGLIETLSLSLASTRRQHEFLRVPAQPSELQLVYSEPASYPRQALLRNVEGWVDVDFVVDRNGMPRDIEVTATEPPGIFERSATNAVERYRYEPFVLDGEVYERRVALRLLFTLD